jgi:uncharacterized membrane protein
MDDIKEKNKASFAQRLWLIVGGLIVLFSFIFLLPPIIMAVTGNYNLGTYINRLFIPFLFTLLLVFIVLVVVYIWSHMANQTDLLNRLDKIEDKLNYLAQEKESKEIDLGG